MKKIRTLLITIISMISGSLISLLLELGEGNKIKYALFILLFVLIAIIVLLSIQIIKAYKNVRYSVLIFVLDENNRLASLYNEYHKRIMIPCGVIKPTQTPIDAVNYYISRDIGIDINKCHSIFQNNDLCKLTPDYSQIEFVTKHERRIRQHYGFIFCYRINDKNDITKPIKFYSYDELCALSDDCAMFSDLMSRYKNILNLLEKKG